ncbi:MAG: hypothetical protein V4581_19015 [Bacteroidota bacterium]
MKKILLLVALALFTVACSDDTDTVTTEPQVNKVLLLKVDLTTNAFEGGKELEFADADSFTIDADYDSPFDFGSIKLIYSETNTTLFDAGIVWMGTGAITYPESLDLPDTFAPVGVNVPMPEFEMVFGYTGDPDYQYYYDDVNYTAIWNAVNNLDIVKQYRTSNPEAKAQLFLYTPGIGIGDPAYWKWIIFLKN